MQRKNYFTAIKIALIVGTILNTINSYEAIRSNLWSNNLIFKILLTYCVPFCVSIYSSYLATKSK